MDRQATKQQLEAILSANSVPCRNGCIEWTGRRNAGGYGLFSLNATPWKAHRAAYYVAHGDIPSGHFVCHSCDNPRCVHVDHLWVGTVAENNADKVRKGRHAKGVSHGVFTRGEKNHLAKLTAEKVREIRASCMSGIALSSAYGVSPSVISQVRTRKLWRHV